MLASVPATQEVSWVVLQLRAIARGAPVLRLSYAVSMARDRTMTDDLMLASLRDRVRALDHRVAELGRHL